MLSRKTYVDVAKIFTAIIDETPVYDVPPDISPMGVVNDIIEKFVEYFATDNPNFNPTKFYKAIDKEVKK